MACSDSQRCEVVAAHSGLHRQELLKEALPIGHRHLVGLASTRQTHIIHVGRIEYTLSAIFSDSASGLLFT
jgi:hypothetical protein